MDRRRRLNSRQRRFPQLHHRRISLFFLFGVSVLLQILLITRTEYRSEIIDLPSYKNDLNAASSNTQHGKHSDENEKVSAGTTKLRPPRLFSVMSTECSPFHDWQAQTLIHNHKKQGIQGFLVRLMACDDPNYILPKHSYEKYRVVIMPNFGLRGGDNWR